MLTPLDIHNKEFKRSFRGYNEDEIDDFLDQVVNDYEKLFRENDNLKEELSRMKKDNAQYQKLENNLKETLLIAQKTANEVTDTAKQHAEKLRESTAKERQLTRQMVEAADHQVKSATVEYCRLVEAKSQFLYQIKAALESELAVLHDAIDRLPRQQSAEPQQETKAEAAAAQDAASQQGAAAADGAVQKG